MKIVVFALLLSAHCEQTTALKRQQFYFSNSTTWTKAQSHCRGSYVDLSSLDSWNDLTTYSTPSGSSGLSGKIWIGLKLNSTNNWEWSDGRQRSFSPWGSYQPNLQGNDICAAVQQWYFYDEYCSYSFPYFCYKWEPELIVVKEKKSWEDALQYCRTQHNDLASLPTDLHLIQAKQATAETSSVWTGLRFLAGSWFWLSDEDLGYVSGQLPACPANYTYCGSLNLKTQSFENRNCNEELNFVCY